ncbi:MAG: ABC transporter permease, partial [Undibacterium sp.]|nr:ABC transporter permease [Undibacterium sp.]
MKFQDFKVAWRLLVKEPSYSIIVIFGLAVGVALCYLLFGLVRHQYSYDDQIPDNQQIYYVNEFWRILGDSGKAEGVSLPAMQAVVQSGLPVQATMVRSRNVDARVEDRLLTMNLSLVSPDFRSIFSVQALRGDVDAAISRPDTAALTEESAIKLFGNIDVLGKTFSVQGVPYTVRAILPTPPANSSLNYQAIAGFNSQYLDDKERQYLLSGWGTWVGHVYFKTANPATVPLIQQTMDAAFKKSTFYARLAAKMPKDLPSAVEFRIGKLRDRNLDPYVTNSPLQRPGILAAISAVGAIVLLLAMANFLNLSTVRSIRRQREIAIRKVLGATSNRLLQQFFTESILVCLLAYLLGMFFAWLLLPIFSSMVGLVFPRMFDISALVVSLLLTLILALACAFYPGWIALKVLPTAALAGRGDEENKGGLRLRRVLSVLQFSAAMGLTATGLSYAWQGEFLSQMNPGFDAKNLLVVRPAENGETANGRAFQEA